VRDAIKARGHNVISCDLLPTDNIGPHYRVVCSPWAPDGLEFEEEDDGISL
jgi:hypothetical protein